MERNKKAALSYIAYDANDQWKDLLVKCDELDGDRVSRASSRSEITNDRWGRGLGNPW